MLLGSFRSKGMQFYSAWFNAIQNWSKPERELWYGQDYGIDNINGTDV